MATASNKRKKAVAATIAAAAILLAGTFAWTSISQQALNESAGIVNVGGRLHDDFNGTNKDVYVENFTDPLKGGQPIYARVKLTEYMEVGQEAGGRGDTDGDGINEAVPVINNTSIDKKEEWPAHVPSESCAKCNTGDTCAIHDHWKWEMGGETVYMPTFNKDKDSLEADVNGTYHGTDRSLAQPDKVYYDDYVEYAVSGGSTVDLTESYTTPEGKPDATRLTEENKAITTVKGTAYYDDDTDGKENTTAGQYRTEAETHTAKSTVSAQVITMAQWLEDGEQQGNYWVYDTDGWAYWAAPIMPGQATGLLLDEIKMTQNPGEKCYYAINVIGEFATAGDWEFFNDGAGLAADSNALKVMEAASSKVPTVTVNSDANTVAPGGTLDFEATEGTIVGYAENQFTWSVYDEDGNPLDSTKTTTKIDENGKLTVDQSATEGTIYVVAAESVKNPGAVGMKSVTVAYEPLETTDEMTAKTYAILTDDGQTNEDGTDTETYKLSLVRSVETPTTSHEYDGKPIVAVQSDIENSGVGINSLWNSEEWKDKITSIVTENDIKLSERTNLNSVANSMSALQKVDFSKLDTSAVSGEVSRLCYYCDSLEEVILPEGAFSNATEFFQFITYCPKLKTFTMSGSYPKVKSMKQFVTDCKGLESVDLSDMKLQTETPIDFSTAFGFLAQAETIKLPENIKLSSMHNTFYDCKLLETLEGIETWDLSEVTDCISAFENCERLEDIDGVNWKLGANCTTLAFMFSNCSALKTIEGAISWDTSAVTNMQFVFRGCSSLILNCSNWDTSEIANSEMHTNFNSGAPGVTAPSWKYLTETTTE